MTSTSPVTKDTVLPPHLHSPLSSNSHLSPRLLTPDSDHSHPPHSAFGDTLTFAKQPLPAPKPSAQSGLSARFSPRSHAASLSPGDGDLPPPPHDEGQVSDAGTGYGTSPGRQQHLSLLTAILSSPEHQSQMRHQRVQKQVQTQDQRKVALPAALSDYASNPSTTMSSPVNPPHGILQTAQTIAAATRPSIDSSVTPGANIDANAKTPLAPPAVLTTKPSSILRRGSASGASDGAPEPVASMGMAMTGINNPPANDVLSQGKKAEEKRERVGWADAVPKPDLAPLARAPSATSASGRLRLSFAVAQPPSHGSGSASEASEAPSKRNPSVSASSSRRPSSPFAKERKVQESLDERDSAEELRTGEHSEASSPSSDEEAHLPGYVPRSTASTSGRSDLLISPNPEPHDDDSDDESDLGYQEDEEDGMFSDEEETTAFDLSGNDIQKRKFAFARSTNYFRGRRRPSRGGASDNDNSPLTTPPSAPSYFPAPNRRGRGHIRVADNPKVGITHLVKEKSKGCTRHCSPPPSARSRTGSVVEAPPPAAASPSARFMRRSDAEHPGAGADGKTKGAMGNLRVEVAKGVGKMKVGSPMPPRLDIEDEDDDEDEDVEMDEDGEEEDEDPSRIEDEDEDEDEKDVERLTPSNRDTTARGGWRSDDSVFYGPNSRSARQLTTTAQPPPRNVSAPPPNLSVPDAQETVFASDDDSRDPISPSQPDIQSVITGPPGAAASGGDGVRNWIRRASEHLPLFRRPSATATNGAPLPSGQMSRNASVASASARSEQSLGQGTASGTGSDSRRASRDASRETSKDQSHRGSVSIPVPRTTPIPSSSTVPAPPALDNTPITGTSAPRTFEGGLTYRLEKTLAITPNTTPPPVSNHQNTSSVPPAPNSAAQAVASGSSQPPQPVRSSISSNNGFASAVHPAPTSVQVGFGPAPAQSSDAPLNRTTSLSGKVTFQPAERPVRDAAPRRAVSGASHYLAMQQSANGGAEGSRNRSKLHWSDAHTESGARQEKSVPIRCPKLVKKGEDLGWSDEALLSIRKNAGKVQP